MSAGTGLAQPVDVALVGAGHRSQSVYYPLMESLQPWLRVVAVCDPVREHADELANSLQVPAFYSLQELVRSRPMEAAIVVVPIEAHYAISCYLSEHGVHNLIETSMCSTLAQARRMVDTARASGVMLRIAENFFRFPFDRIAKKVSDSGFIGPVKRLTCFQDHLGYHNNSRWIVFYGAYPESVQAIQHTMPVAPHYESPRRYHEDESFQARFFYFPGDRLVTDLAGNIKGLLGRHPRPGYIELDGTRGAIVQRAARRWDCEAEVRSCSDEALRNGGSADGVFPIVHTSEDGCWASTYVDLPTGRVEYPNSYRPAATSQVHPIRDYYAACVMGHVVDFAHAVRGVASSEYDDADAMMSMMMEVGARESALRGGERLDLPLTEDLEAESVLHRSLHEKLGVDPLDVEAMLAISYPRP